MFGAWLSTSMRGAAVVPTAEPGYTPPMPQKPQVRAKNKRRLTKRLAAWRAKQEAAGQTREKADAKGKPAAGKPEKRA